MSASFPSFKINSFYSFFAAPVLSLFLLPAMAQADSVGTPTLTDLPSSLDLNDFAAWAFYADVPSGDFGYSYSNPSPTTNATGSSASFSALTGNGFENDGEAYTPVTYTGGAGGPNPSAETGANDFDFTIGSLSLTTKLIATTETLHFYLDDYNGAADISIKLGSNSTDTLYSNTALPQILNGDSNGDGDNVGELSVTVQGTVGELLDFTLAPNNTDFRPRDASGHTGVQAVTIDVPEPSTYAMMFAGLAFLGFRLRGRSIFRA